MSLKIHPAVSRVPCKMTPSYAIELPAAGGAPVVDREDLLGIWPGAAIPAADVRGPDCYDLPLSTTPPVLRMSLALPLWPGGPVAIPLLALAPPLMAGPPTDGPPEPDSLGLFLRRTRTRSPGSTLGLLSLKASVYGASHCNCNRTSSGWHCRYEPSRVDTPLRHRSSTPSWLNTRRDLSTCAKCKIYRLCMRFLQDCFKMVGVIMPMGPSSPAAAMTAARGASRHRGRGTVDS